MNCGKRNGEQRHVQIMKDQLNMRIHMIPIQSGQNLQSEEALFPTSLRKITRVFADRTLYMYKDPFHHPAIEREMKYNTKVESSKV